MLKFYLYAFILLATLLLGGVVGLVVMGLTFSPTNFILYCISYCITFLFNRGLTYFLKQYFS